MTGCNNLTNMAFQILFLIEPLSKSLEMLAMGDRHITADGTLFLFSFWRVLTRRSV